MGVCVWEARGKRGTRGAQLTSGCMISTTLCMRVPCSSVQSAGQAEIQKQVAMVERRLTQDPTCMLSVQEALRDRDALRDTVGTLEGTVRDATLEIEVCGVWCAVCGVRCAV
jgi:hypothetical protein